MFKNLGFTILALTTLLSCTTVQKDNRVYIKSYKIDTNTVSKLDFKDKVNLSNKEINLYHIDNLNVEGIPKIKIDIDYEKAIADSFVINKVNEGVIILDFNEISKLRTVKKEIVLMRIPKTSKLKVELSNPNKIIDNTVFRLLKVDKNEYSFYVLKPFFLDEDTFVSKEKENVEKTINVAEYNENLFVEYYDRKVENDLVYNSYFLEMIDGKIIKGNGMPKAEIEITYNNKTITTIVNENGVWEAPLPSNFKGEIKLIQKTIDKNNKVIYTDPITQKVGD